MCHNNYHNPQLIKYFIENCLENNSNVAKSDAMADSNEESYPSDYSDEDHADENNNKNIESETQETE